MIKFYSLNIWNILTVIKIALSSYRI